MLGCAPAVAGEDNAHIGCDGGFQNSVTGLVADYVKTLNGLDTLGDGSDETPNPVRVHKDLCKLGITQHSHQFVNKRCACY
ncbi:MAG: hypothetical protein ACRDQZ_04095 [Mycobacteriales bacterium]